MNPSLVFGLGGFVYFQLSRTSYTDTKNLYKDLKVSCRLPSWVFPVVWNIIYPLIIVSGYFAFLESNKFDIYLIVLFFVNIMFNKFWSVLFWDMQKPLLALLSMIPMIGTAIVYFVLVAVLNNWYAFGFYAAYILWLPVACYLNWDVVRHYNEKQTDEPVNKKIMSPAPKIARKIVLNL
jgi:tryptophan-rich sensory protein